MGMKKGQCTVRLHYDTPESPRTSQHYCIKGFKRGSKLVPHYAERR